MFKRSYDARKKSAIQLIYTVDCELSDEASLLAQFAGDPHIKPTPTPATNSSAMRRWTSSRAASAPGLWSSALAPAASLPP